MIAILALLAGLVAYLAYGRTVLRSIDATGQALLEARWRDERRRRERLGLARKPDPLRVNRRINNH